MKQNFYYGDEAVEEEVLQPPRVLPRHDDYPGDGLWRGEESLSLPTVLPRRELRGECRGEEDFSYL